MRTRKRKQRPTTKGRTIAFRPSSPAAERFIRDSAWSEGKTVTAWIHERIFRGTDPQSFLQK